MYLPKHHTREVSDAFEDPSQHGDSAQVVTGHY
jgi:hypothetical protein